MKSKTTAAGIKRVPRQADISASAAGVRTFVLYDGSTARIGPDGLGSVASPNGAVRPAVLPMSGGRSALGDTWGPSDREIIRRLSLPQRGTSAPDEMIVVLSGSGTPSASGTAPSAVRAQPPLTGDVAIDAALRSAGGIGATHLVPASSGGAKASGGSGRGLDLARAYLVRLGGADPRRATERLRGIPGVAYAGVNWNVASMSVEPRDLPSWAADRAREALHVSPAAGALTANASTLPTNYGFTSSFESWLNSSGVNAAGAFDILSRRFGRLPGEGVIITNVSIGDLTDQSMADAGDPYVQAFGPTTVLIKGQRYLDIPSMPLIPAWSVAPGGMLDPRGAVEHVDPFLSEVLLDFSVMAPLPHSMQRPGATGDGLTDLLGLAPGATYRLVVPQQPTISNILAALVAASRQKPRPDVITASLGFGVDSVGFPGRYLEDDPVVLAAIRSIVQDLGIVVCISANDGTRLFVPTAVGPDGGSAPTEIARPGETPTSIGQVALSTAPSRIDDSGAIDVGGSTLDDVFSAPPQGNGPLASTGSFPETRLNGSTDFSSGFGSRVNIAAPSDNIPALVHACNSFYCPAQGVLPTLNGGTSASAPMVAAAAAIVIQSARLAGRSITPAEVRDLLIRTGRTLPNPPQIARPLQVGPQLDVTAAVESILGPDASPMILRLGVAHRQAIGFLGASFLEATDPGAIDLQGPYDFGGQPIGQNVTGTITFAPDVVGLAPSPGLTFALTIGSQTFTQSGRVLRLFPAQLLDAAGQTIVSTSPRAVPATYEIRSASSVLASTSLTLVFSPSDGIYAEALAPVAPAVVAPGQGMKVSYDLTNVRFVDKPHLVISSVNHWSPAAAPLYRSERSIPLAALRGTVTVPPQAFTGGSGIYGIGIEQNAQAGFLSWFTTVRVTGAAGENRPPAPTLAAAGQGPGFFAGLSRKAPGFTVAWDASGVAGAAGAVLEISAPGPTIYGSINTFTNHNGDRRDANGGDSGSFLWYPLPGVSGSLSLDATMLEIPSSLSYAARVLAIDRKNNVTGLASPVAGLSFDDGVTPGAEIINDFDIVPGGGSIVATAGFDGGGNLIDSALRRYDPSTGAYGASVAADAKGQSIYYMFGSDTALHRTSTIRYDWFDTLQRLETFDSLTGKKLASLPVDAGTQFAIIGGRVDSARHRASLLAQSGSDFSDNVLPLDMATLKLGSPVFADVGTDDRGLMTTLDVDASTGKAFVARMLWGDLCIFLDPFIASVDLNHASASSVSPAGNCITGIGADQKGSEVHLTIGPIFAFPALLPVARHQTVDQTTLAASQLDDLGARSPLFPVADPVNGLLLVGFTGQDDYTSDNNAMSAVGVFDLTTGRRLALLPRFNFIAEVFGGNGLVGNERGIQIDPATRTGWTYGPNGVQVQQFKY